MYIIIIFLGLSLIEFLLIWWKWSNIKDYQEAGAGVDNHVVYKKWVKMVGHVLNNFKTLLIIPIGILAFINFIISLFLGGILAFIF